MPTKIETYDESSWHFFFAKEKSNSILSMPFKHRATLTLWNNFYIYIYSVVIIWRWCSKVCEEIWLKQFQQSGERSRCMVTCRHNKSVICLINYERVSNILCLTLSLCILATKWEAGQMLVLISYSAETCNRERTRVAEQPHTSGPTSS